MICNFMIFSESVGSGACLSATCKDANHICGSHLLFVIICNVLNITRLLNEYGAVEDFLWQYQSTRFPKVIHSWLSTVISRPSLYSPAQLD